MEREKKKYFSQFFRQIWKIFHKNFKKAVGTFKNKIIAGYNPINHEVNCLKLLNFASKEGSKIALPYTNKNKILEFREWNFDDPLKKIH